MGKPVSVVGDLTSHGGTVITGAPTATTNGKPIARVGDMATCPIPFHGGVTTIVSGDPATTVMGKPVARHGDVTACGATIIATQAQTTDG